MIQSSGVQVAQKREPYRRKGKSREGVGFALLRDLDP